MMQTKALSLSIENLFTDRCHIRLFQEKDLERFIQYRNNLSWMQYQGCKGLTPEQYRQELLQPHPLSEGIQLAVADRQTDILLGDLYLRQEKDCCWIGYTISPDYARQGYGFEAVEGLIQWVLCRRTPLPSLCCKSWASIISVWSRTKQSFAGTISNNNKKRSAD